MARWKDTLRSIRQFKQFTGLVASLFDNADDEDELAQAMKDGDFEKAAAEANLSEKEFAGRIREIEGTGEELVKQDEVLEALNEYEQDHCEAPNS